MSKKIKKSIFSIPVIVIIIAIIGGFAYYYFFILRTSGTKTSEVDEVNTLTFYHWWTSPGESAAINALADVFANKYPDVKMESTPIVGGGGFSMLEEIKPLVSEGKAPDAFQMHAGYESKPYFDAGLLSQIDDVWESNNLEDFIPSIVQDMNKFEGHYYSVPVDIHRSNLVWYNKYLLTKNNINLKNLITWDAFFDACDVLKANGVKYPIQIGEVWTISHVFEQIMVSMGIDFYEDWVNGKIVTADMPKLLESLNVFKKYLSYTNPDYINMTWDEATARIISGESAFNIMGDWANGEFKVAGKAYGVDYGAFAVPGTENMYGLVIDTFQHPKNIAHPINAGRWLAVVSSAEGQDAFNPLKGSISARTDSDVSKYDAYQQFAILDFWEARYMFPSIVHGSGAPESFKLMLNDIISKFADDLDIQKTADSIAGYTNDIKTEYTIDWSLK